MATVAVLLTLIAGPGWFAKQTLYDTDIVVARVDTALDDERVQLAIADKVTDELFIIAGINRDEATEALIVIDEAAAEGEDGATPDGESAENPGISLNGTTGDEEADEGNLVFDIPVANALQTVATQRAVAIVASDRLDDVILAAVRDTHEEFVAVADRTVPPNDDGTITIDLEPVVIATLDAVADDPVLGFLATDDVEVGDSVFIVAHDGQGGSIWWTIMRSFPDWTNLALLGAVALLGGAIIMSPERDRIMLSSGVAIAAIALIIAAGAWAARAIVSTVFIRDEIPRGAFETVYDTLSAPLISLEIRIAIFAAILAAIGGLLGFVLDWRAERALAAQDDYDDDRPIYQSQYENSGIPPGPQR